MIHSFLKFLHHYFTFSNYSNWFYITKHYKQYQQYNHRLNVRMLLQDIHNSLSKYEEGHPVRKSLNSYSYYSSYFLLVTSQSRNTHQHHMLQLSFVHPTLLSLSIHTSLKGVWSNERGTGRIWLSLVTKPAIHRLSPTFTQTTSSSIMDKQTAVVPLLVYMRMNIKCYIIQLTAILFIMHLFITIFKTWCQKGRYRECIL